MENIANKKLENELREVKKCKLSMLLKNKKSNTLKTKKKFKVKIQWLNKLTKNRKRGNGSFRNKYFSKIR